MSLPLNPQGKLAHSPRTGRLTRSQTICAITLAVVADVLQLLLGPFGWAFADQIIDVIAAILVSRAIGFHWLFLPSFVVELIPVVGMLPTWTACVAAVLTLRRKEEVTTIDV